MALREPARERAHRGRTEGALRVGGRRQISETAPLLHAFEPRGQRRALLARVEADAARRLVRARARELRRRVPAEPLRLPFVAPPHGDARARQRGLEQCRALVEPALRGAVARVRRELQERVGERACAFERLALGGADLDRDDVHHRLRRAARRRQRAQK